MNWTRLSLKTLIPQIPKIINDNNDKFKSYVDVFYDEGGGVIIKPLSITGKVKAGTGEFVNLVTDNLTIKKQYTNLYENVTTVDSDFANAYNGSVITTRTASADTSSNVIWPLESSSYIWVDVMTPYIKISDGSTYGLQNSTVGQETRIIFDVSSGTLGDFSILLNGDPSISSELIVTASEATNGTWIKLISIGYDVSYGSKWVIKESGGDYNIS